jgi:hypothetical protein
MITMSVKIEFDQRQQVFPFPGWSKMGERRAGARQRFAG